MSSEVQLTTIRDAASYPFVYAHGQVGGHAQPATQVASYQQSSLSTQHHQQQQLQNGHQEKDHNGHAQQSSDSASVSSPPTSALAQLAVVTRWSTTDDVALADALVEQKRTGRSRDTIFSADAWVTVSALFETPTWAEAGGPKTLAQCKARWQRLKIEYRMIKQLRAEPGFSWNEEQNMVIAADASWDAYIAKHRDSQCWRRKSFPAYVQVAWLAEDDTQAADTLRQRYEKRAKDQGVTDSEAERSASAGFTTSTKSDIPQHPFRRTYRKRQPPAQNGQLSTTKRTRSNPTSPALATPPTQPYVAVPYTPYSVAPPHPSYPPPPVGAYPPIHGGMPGTAPPPPPPPHPAASMHPPVSTPSPSPVTSQPSQMALAIQTVEETEGLSDQEFVKAVRLFNRRPETSDAYLAIKSRRSRSLYLRAELEEVGRTAQS